MDSFDPSLLFDDEPTAQEKALAQAAALMGQSKKASQLGAIGALMGSTGSQSLMDAGQSLGGYAQNQQASAQHGQQLLQQLADRKQQRAIEAAREQSEADFKKGDLAYKLAALQQGKFQATPYGLLNTKAGQLEPYAQTPGGAAPSPLAGLKPDAIEKLWTEFGKAISKTSGRANLNAENQKRLQAVGRLEGLMNGETLTPEEQRLLETDLASVYAGGGAPTEGQVEHLHPGTWKGSLAKTLEWATNTPQDVGAQAFVQRLKGRVGELKDTIGQQVLEGQASGIPRYIALRGANGPRFEAMLKGNGIDPTLLDEQGLLRPKTPAAVTTSPAHTHWLISPDKKQRIPAGADGKPLPGARAEPNPNAPKEVAARG